MKVVDLTPNLAAKYLLSNTGNRQINKKNVDLLSIQMENGDWKYTADPIRFAKNGRLLDGQHRLSAIVKSGVTIKALIITDLEEDVFDCMDTHSKRTAGDVISMKGISNANAIGAISKMIMRFNIGNYGGVLNGSGVSKLSDVTNSKIAKFSNENDLQEYYKIGIRFNSSCKFLTSSQYSFLYYVLSKIDEADANIFFEKLVYGVNLQERDPVLYLRNKLLNDFGSNSKLGPTIKLGYIFKGWNLFRTKQERSNFTFSINDKVPQPK